MKEKRRIKWYDVARSVALISIVSNHAISRVFDNYVDQQLEFMRQTAITQLFKSIVTTFSWIGVPIFLMLSGVLILNKKFETKEDLKRFYKNNWLLLVVSTEFWSALGYIFITLFIYKYSISLDWFINLLKTLLFLDKIEFGCMWYMDMIICLYTVLPVLAVFLKKFSSFKDMKVLVFVILWIGFIFPTFNKYSIMLFNKDYANYLSSGYLFSTYLLFVILGYFIEKGLLSRLKSLDIILGLGLSFSLTVILQYIGYSSEYNLVTRYDSVGILLSSIYLFEFMRRYCNGFSDKIMKFIKSFSKNAFSIYMIHIFFVEFIYYQYLNREIVIVNAEITTFIYMSIPIICSIIIIQILKNIGFVKKYFLLIKD